MRYRRIRVLAMAGAIASAVSVAQTQPQPDRPARIAGRPNFNGVWQALNTAYWNLEGHSAEALNDFWQLGAIAAIPAGRSDVRYRYAPPHVEWAWLVAGLALATLGASLVRRRRATS